MRSSEASFRYSRFVRHAARGLVVTTEYYWVLLRKNLLCKCMSLIFAMGQDFFEKTGTKALLKNYAREYGYWQNGLEIEKRYVGIR